MSKGRYDEAKAYADGEVTSTLKLQIEDAELVIATAPDVRGGIWRFE